MAEPSMHESIRPTTGRKLKSAQLRKHLTTEVITGRLKPGTRLPSEVQLADDFDVSRPTVRRALAEMEGEGLIRREHGRGTFVRKETASQSEVTAGTFAMVISGASDIGGMAMVRGFEQACRTTHHNMFLCESENDINLQAGLVFRLAHLEISGVAFHPVLGTDTPEYHVTTLHKRGVPVVFCHRSVEGIRAPVLSVSHEEEGRLAGQAIAEKGHRRVALMLGAQAEGVRDKYVRGVRKALKKSGGELPNEFIFSSKNSSLDYSKQESELSEALEAMLGAENPPTAIFGAPDEFAQTIYMLLQRMGLRVPEDISLVGVGDINRIGPFARQLTSVVIDGAEMGRRVVEMLEEMQNGDRDLHSTENIAMPITLSEGRTLGPAPATPLAQNLN